MSIYDEGSALMLFGYNVCEMETGVSSYPSPS